MRMTEKFPLDEEGRASVKTSGLYYIYAQVNYLDEHDVNAFQVYINEDPYLLCTGPWCINLSEFKIQGVLSLHEFWAREKVVQAEFVLVRYFACTNFLQ